MGDRRTIEDVLGRYAMFTHAAVRDLSDNATVDGPVFSEDGSLAVIRPSRGLTQSLREAKRRIAELESAIAAAMLCADQRVHDPEFSRALSTLWALAAPAPADPEEGDQ